MSQNGHVLVDEQAALSALQHASSAAAHASKPSSLVPSGRRRRALMWGIASTVLSAIGLLGLGLFEQYNGMISELRADLKHFNETAGEYVKKDRLQKLKDLVKESSKEISASSAAREQLERELRASERAREEMAKELQHMRERLAYLEGFRASRPSGTPEHGEKDAP
jgi:hypothetical protein